MIGYDRTTQKEVGFQEVPLQRHVAVLGSTGSGKTYAAKVLLEEAALAGIPILGFDTQGDVLSLAFSEDPIWQERVQVWPWTIGSDEGLRMAMPLRVPWETPEQNFSAKRSREIAFEQIRSVLGTETSPFTLQTLAEELQPRDIISFCEKITQLPMDHPCRSLSLVAYAFLASAAAEMYKGAQVSIHKLLEARHGGRTPVHIVSLDPSLPPDQLSQVVGSLAAQVSAWMTTGPRPSQGEARCIFFLDEAAPYLPPVNKKTPPSKGPLMDLLRKARKYGVGCILATQSPGDVDYQGFEQFNTWLVGRIGHPTAVRKVQDALGETLGGVQSLKQGDFYLFRQGTLTPFRSRPLITRDGLSNPAEVRLSLGVQP